ncbi:GAF and ANTAR domain-containing protein [Mycobacterium parmense]|uniref:Uncharacterized protein n=1 Tax=Mycobacterium parmense TaxID=185642 RepID=A0A7I7YP91_9MYCO|nr:GAF and ANTAR domain-containing protein [Mycobacterium parmense]MCV7349671.1 GAF and ANTAR domain-containing protein [Mycobacterium parmense]ORW51870.1 hypothetical protein AWC20_22295 [Mycobacterium parmense]BBZ43678.1 hypothetical protein MPRM_09590 [Mycobacterium parmense]
MNEQVLSLAHELVEIGRLRENDDSATVLQRLVQRAKRTIPGCDHVSVTVRVGDSGDTGLGGLETVAGDEVPSVAHSASEREPWPGPIADAARYREPRRVDDAQTERRWADFPYRMAQAGFRSCLALPVPTDRHPQVCFALFSGEPHQFSDHALDLVLLFALQGGAAIDNASLYSDARELVGHLHEALITREIIGRSKGILMQRLSCDDDTAFDILRRISQHHNIKVREVANDIAIAQERGELDAALGRWFTDSAGAPQRDGAAG